MRQKINRQMSIFELMHSSAIAKELLCISHILEQTTEVLDAAHHDLLQGRRDDTGRIGLTADQVLRCAVLKQYRELTYEELAFHLEDSAAFRAFARLGMGVSPSKSVLQENIKSLSESTWEALHQLVVDYARTAKIETGKKVRIDSTAIETNIHAPTDSSLLADGIRIMTRWMVEGHQLNPCPAYRFSDHRRVAKKRALKILNARKKQTRVAAYRDLVGVAHKVCTYARQAIPVLGTYRNDSFQDGCTAHLLAQKLERALRILEKIIDQAERRVFKGEIVPASEKIISLFESHSDIIVKSRRDTEYGHKVFFTGGASNMILDCMIPRGNPADSAQYTELLERHEKAYDHMPRQISADGGFASKENLAFAKEHQVKDAVFSKRRGLGVLDMAKSNWVYKRLRNFRAGIEANISALKRRFGLSRCTWTGWRGFRRYVWSNIVSYNLLVLARIELAKG
jgi:transposase, IS5 family